jgi:uncharacterized protein (DUF1697 family)
MTAYVALLRGVNLGNVRVAMADLREIGVTAGFTAVSTHLNSGNLLFTSSAGSAAEHAATISAGIKAAIGRPIPVVIRTPGQLQKALDAARAQFPKADETRVAIAFLDQSAGPGPADRLGSFDDEEYLVKGAEVLLHYPTGQARSKLIAPVMEKKLGVVATVRGLKTVAGLIAKSG